MRFVVFIVGLSIADALVKPHEKEKMSEQCGAFVCGIGFCLLMMDVAELIAKP